MRGREARGEDRIRDTHHPVDAIVIAVVGSRVVKIEGRLTGRGNM